MTVKLSPHKVRRILRGYFNGLPQTTIANKVAVNQGSVSIYASEFKKLTAMSGILAAGKEFGVENEVDALRSLSVELYKADLTVADAQQGVAIIKTFRRMDVEPEQHALLIEVCKEVRDPEFVKAAVELTSIENTTRMNFHQAIERLQEVSTQLPPLEDRLQNRETKLYSINSMIKERQQEQADLDRVLSQSREEAEKVIREREAKLSKKMKQLNVKEIEVSEATKLKSELAKRGLDLSTLIKAVEEFPDDSN